MAKAINMIEQLPQLKRNYINLDMLFNTRAKGNNLRVATFVVRDKIKINKGAVVSTCNGVPTNCNSSSELEVPANEQLSFNEIFNECNFHELKNDPVSGAEIVNDIASEWVEAEATYAYSNFTGTDITADLEADTSIVNVYDEIVFGIKALIDKGYNVSHIVVALDEKFTFDFKALDLACCDLAKALSDEKSSMALKLGVLEVFSVPAKILSGDYDGTGLASDPTTAIKFRIYVKQYALLNTYCERGPILTEVPSGEFIGATEAFASEKIGFGMYDAIGAEVHAFYESTPVIPAPTAPKKVDKEAK